MKSGGRKSGCGMATLEADSAMLAPLYLYFLTLMRWLDLHHDILLCHMPRDDRAEWSSAEISKTEAKTNIAYLKIFFSHIFVRLVEGNSNSKNNTIGERKSMRESHGEKSHIHATLLLLVILLVSYRVWYLIDITVANTASSRDHYYQLLRAFECIPHE